MTVEVETSRVTYTGSGTTGPFTIPFYFIRDEDIRAIKVLIADGTETELALSTDFTLTGEGDEEGGELTLAATLSSSYQLMIFRDPELLQEVAYPRTDPFPSSSHEQALDLAMMVDQRTRDMVERSMRFSDGALLDSFDPALPTAEPGAYLRVALDGSGFEWVSEVDPAEESETFLQSGTGAVPRTWTAKVGEAISVKDFGAVGDGVTNDAAAIQAAVDYAETLATGVATGATVHIPPGEYNLGTTSIVIDADAVKIKGAGDFATVIKFAGTSGAAFQGNATRRNYCGVSDLAIWCTGDGGKGIDFTWFSYGTFQNFSVGLREQNQTAVYAKGNGLGTSPYYNTFDNFSINGRADFSTYPNQIGVQLAPATSGSSLADGPNGNLFSNVRRVSGVSIGFDVQSGNANLGTNIHIENVETYGFAFNNRAADFTGTATSGNAESFTDLGAAFTGLGGGAWKIVGGTGNGLGGNILSSTGTAITLQLYTNTGVLLDNTSQYQLFKSKAIGNKFTNVRLESDAASSVARFYPGANSNLISACADTGPTTKWVKDVAESSNAVLNKPLNQIVALTHWLDNVPANATTPLNPSANSAVAAGMKMWGEGSVILGASAAINDLNGAAGSGTVRFYKAGVEITALSMVLNANTRFGNHSYTKNGDESSTIFLLASHDLDVQIETNASWNATTKDLVVTVWLLI